MRESLYKYSENELSLRVFNDEHLYKQRHDKGFIRMIHQIFRATNRQVFVLKQDLAADLTEIKNQNQILQDVVE